jgi:hypothetical protein
MTIASAVAALARRLRPAGQVTAIVLTIVLGSGVMAAAGTGGAFLLGRSNSESSTTRLTDSRGTPLSLSAPKNTAPLEVNRGALVRNLNAEYLGGHSAASLRTTGAAGFSADGYIATSGYTKVASTQPVAAGTYYVTAAAYVNLSGTGGTGAICVVALDGDYLQPLQGSRADVVSGGLYAQTAQTLAVTLQTGSVLQEWCAPTGPGAITESPIADSAGITAIRILSSSG